MPSKVIGTDPGVTNSVVFPIKRFMGRTYDEVSSKASRAPYHVVPAPNGDAQRQATKDAGKIAGLNVLRFTGFERKGRRGLDAEYAETK